MLSLPIKDSATGLRKVSTNSKASDDLSRKVTKPLTKKILLQSDALPTPDEENSKTAAILAVKQQ